MTGQLKSNSNPPIPDNQMGFKDFTTLEVARDVLAELENTEQVQIQEEVLAIFEKWKYEHGVYPPKSHPFFRPLIELGFRPPDKEQEPAKNYIERETRIALEAGIEPNYIAPWECEDDARSPLLLFFKLCKEKYSPLLEYLNNNDSKHDYIIATLIIMSLDANRPNRCQDAAFKLAKRQASKHRNPALRRRRALKESMECRAKAVEPLKNSIHKYASDYLGEGKPKQVIVQLIHKKIKRPSIRQIRRHLKDHSSGHWLPKKKK